MIPKLLVCEACGELLLRSELGRREPSLGPVAMLNIDQEDVGACSQESGVYRDETRKATDGVFAAEKLASV